MADVVTMPKLGFDMAEGLLLRWVVAEGESIEKGALLAEIETDKATVEVESPYSGVVLKHLVSEQDSVPVNKPIAVIGAKGEEVDLSEYGDGDSAKKEPAKTDAASAEETPSAAASPETAERAAAPPDDLPEGAALPGGVRATPVARNMAREKNLDLSKVAGSGPDGRILKKDVEKALKSAPAATPASRPALGAQPALASAAPEDTRVPLTKLRQAIGRRMVESTQFVPHFYVTYAYDLDALMALRQQVNTMLEGTGEKLSVNDFLVKAAALCLREFPNLNASLGEGEVIHHGHINIGIAVAVEGGLLTVASKDTDLKSVRQIAIELREMVGRAREGKVRPGDIEGSTFSISNLGMYGVDDFTAIINPPEAAILAVGAAQQVPVVKKGELTIGWQMKTTISVDHRVSDGAEAAQFMQALKRYLEEPLRLML